MIRCQGMTAILLALLASACFGLALVLTQFGLRHLHPRAGAAVSIPTATALFWAASPMFLDLQGWQLQAVAIFAVVGLFFPAAVTLLTFEANQRLGPTVAGAVGSTAPLFAVAGAVVFLGEKLTAYGALAVLAVVAGVVILSLRPATAHKPWPPRDLLLPIGAAALRGLAQAAIKAGLAIWPSPFAAGVIGYTVSTASIATLTQLDGQPHWINAKGIFWFALVGVCNGVAVLTMYAALNAGPVIQVAPTVATYPVFALIFGIVLLPAERLTVRIAAGVLLTVAGVAALLLR
jgi:drug/metabolite transporter (DMT)-like permease